MKNILLGLTFLAFFISCETSHKSKENKTINTYKNKKEVSDIISNKDKIIKIESVDGTRFLKEFYKISYPESGEIEGYKPEYISKKVLDKMEKLNSNPDELVLDYDPFINGQDYDGRSISKTIQVKYSAEDNTYTVEFNLFDGDEKKSIKYNLVREDKKIKIGNILSDSLMIIR